MHISFFNAKACSPMLLLIMLGMANSVLAQDLEPRRWAQMPTGLNFFGIGIGHIEGDIFFDPVMKVEDAEFDIEAIGLVYVRSFAIAGKSARVDFSLPYRAGHWAGTVDGEFIHFHRRGFADPRVRLSMLLYGGPAQTPAEFAKSKKSNTVVGAAVAVAIPFGDYNNQRLINLGANRWTVRPQLGVTHTRGKWTSELTGSVFWYSNNNEFWKGNKLETDPLWALQAHVIYAFKPGLWASISTGYGWGGEGTVNGDAKNNPSGNWLTALSFGFPIDRRQGVKVVFLSGRTQKPTGADIDSIVFAYSVMF
jgi:hypothetical protein